MHSYKTQKIFNYSAEQLYKIVEDVNSYPHFLPWCKSIRTLNKINENTIEYELTVGFAGIYEKFATKDTFTPYTCIEIEAIQGPFEYFHNRWNFQHINETSSMVSFFIDFKVKSSLLSIILGQVFKEASHKMVAAFENRAKSIYK